MGWVFTETFGLADNKVLPFGKIRLSYAEAGKEPGAYLLNDVFIPGGSGSGFITGVSSPFLGKNMFSVGDVKGNPDILPEKTSSIEIGADLRFWEGRLGVDFTYYNQTSDGQIIAAQIPTTTGFWSVIKNAGKVENQGFEVVLDFDIIKNQDFRWNLMVNYTRNRNKVISLVDDLEFLAIGQNFASAANYAVVGQPYGVLFGGRWDRTSDGRVVVEDRDGSFYPVWAETDSIIGDPNPDFLMGINNSFTYKGIMLSFLIDWRKGGDIWNGTRGALDYFGASAETADERDANATKVFEGVLASSYYGNESSPSSWVTNSTAAPLGIDYRVGGPGSGFTGPAEPYIEDGSWVRLRELTLGYSFPKSIFGNSGIKLDVAFTGRNLWLSTDYRGIDPETSLRGAANGQGFDYFNMPNTKSYVGSIRFSF
jgi:hypothetical protein